MTAAHGCERDRHAVIAARGCHDTCGRHLARQQVIEGAARLEGAGMLHEFKLEGDRDVRQSQVGAVHDQHRRAPHMGRKPRCGGRDLRRRELLIQDVHALFRLLQSAVYLGD